MSRLPVVPPAMSSLFITPCAVLFITPCAVQFIKFMNGFAGFVMALGVPEQLNRVVQTLGFGHLHLDVTVPRVVKFRDAIMTSSLWNLRSGSPPEAARAWKAFLNYVGGALDTSR